MRAEADQARIRRLMQAFARAASKDVQVHLVGGTTAVLLGWRNTTIDVDFVMQPEDDEILRALPALKESLQVNLETASPLDFIPVPPGWEDRGLFIERQGRVSFFHFDLYAQALAKVERGHRTDMLDVKEMLARKLIDGPGMMAYFAQVEPQLYRFPAVDPATLRRDVESLFGGGPNT